jgi:hypothetical protein
MAGNSLNTERSNQDKLLQMEKQATEAPNTKSFMIPKNHLNNIPKIIL